MSEKDKRKGGKMESSGQRGLTESLAVSGASKAIS